MRNLKKGLEEEKDILKRLSNGDEQAYTLLYLHYLPRLYKYIFPFTNESQIETEEIIQEIFLKVWIKRNMLAGISSFEYYLLRMAKNQLMDAFRRRAAREKHETQTGLYKGEGENTLEHALLYKEYSHIAQQAIASLTPRQQEIFRLSTQDDLSLDEIALRLGISRSAVKKSLYGAIKTIRTYLKDQGDLFFLLAAILSIF